MTPTESEWKTLAENALSVSESFYLFWHEGFGNDSEVLERYKKLIENYENLQGNFKFQKP